METKNVCLKLSTDGFNSFRLFVAPYFCWSMILTIYNLSLGIYMRLEFMFLSMVIPGPNSSGQNVDVCLRPLIDELKQLWSFEALIYDISRKQNFLMNVALMWTINDFPAGYGDIHTSIKMIATKSMYKIAMDMRMSQLTKKKRIMIILHNTNV